MNRLNGWQRLWLVLTILYGLSVVAVTVTVWPKESDILSLWAWDVMRVVVDDIKRETKYSGSVWDFRNAFFEDKTDAEIVRAITNAAQSINLADSKNAGLADYQSNILTIEKKYQKQIKDLSREQLKTVGRAFLVWVIPALTLYALGSAGGWAYRGFKQDLT